MNDGIYTCLKNYFMKNSCIKLIAFTCLIAVSQLLTAQDTIIHVPTGGAGVLYNAIMGDVDASGDRLHPNATYRLARRQVYPIPAMTFNFNIIIDAEEGEGRPPMIVPQVKGLYTMLRQSSTSSLTLKDIMISGIGSDKSIATWGLYVAQGKVVIENCIFNGFNSGAICGMGVYHYNVQVNNSIFRNCQGINNWWEGTPLMFWDALGDTLMVTNSTFFNNTTNVISDVTWFNHGSTKINSFYSKYHRFCHNTVYGSCGGLTTYTQINSEISDNLFVNTFAMGIDTAGYDHGEGAWPGEQTCILPFSKNDSDDMKIKTGIESEADRKIIVRNNIYFWSQKTIDYWASWGDAFPPASQNPIFMNERSLTMFNDNNAYPLLEESDNIEADPMFVDTVMEAKVLAGFFERGDVLYEPVATDRTFPYVRDDFVHHYPGESGISNVAFSVEWPLAENLSYTNLALMTASTTGKQVGDPRWFSYLLTLNKTGNGTVSHESGYYTNIQTITATADDEYIFSHWSGDIADADSTNATLTIIMNEARTITAIFKNTTAIEDITDSFNSRSYPNPFAGVTVIHYSLNNKSNVRLRVFDVHGKEVTVLVNQVQQPGAQYAEFNANNMPNGVYIYILQIESNISTGKIILNR